MSHYEDHCEADACHNHNHGSKPACEPENNNECNMPEMLLELADQAWEELMLEALKEEIRHSCGEKIKEIAKVVSKANKEKWEHKMAAKNHCSNYKAELHQLFTNTHHS